MTTLSQDQLVDRLMTRDCLHEHVMKPMKIKAGSCATCIHLYIDQYNSALQTENEKLRLDQRINDLLMVEGSQKNR